MVTTLLSPGVSTPFLITVSFISIRHEIILDLTSPQYNPLEIKETKSYENMPNVIRLIGRKAIHFIAFNVTINIINQ